MLWIVVGLLVLVVGLLAILLVTGRANDQHSRDLREACRLLMLERLAPNASTEDCRQVNTLAQEASLDELVTLALRPVPKGATRTDGA